MFRQTTPKPCMPLKHRSFDSTAAFGRPVVPEVKTKKQGSFWSTVAYASGTPSGRASSRSSKGRAQEGRGHRRGPGPPSGRRDPWGVHFQSPRWPEALLSLRGVLWRRWWLSCGGARRPADSYLEAPLRRRVCKCQRAWSERRCGSPASWLRRRPCPSPGGRSGTGRPGCSRFETLAS